MTNSTKAASVQLYPCTGILLFLFSEWGRWRDLCPEGAVLP